MKKILITGVPGTGKTTIGEHLKRFEFIHLDMEKSTPEEQAIFLKTKNHNTVITWGFMPGNDDDCVLELQKAGYTMIWFDGNREAARKAFNKRGTVPEHLLDLQMARIETMDLVKFNPIIINTFNTKGEFRDKNEIATEILKR